MRRAIIALLTAMAFVFTGLTLSPQRVTALGETSVTLGCTDGTSLTLLVDPAELTSLTAAVQGMIDYPAGLSCTLKQNPLPLTTSFGRIALAANPNTMVVAGGRWQVGCSSIFDYDDETLLPGSVVALAGTRPVLASLISPAPATDCGDLHGCIWVNIGVNVHFRDATTTLEGTLNETMPENQTCPDPVTGEPVPVGPSHFTSTPTCLVVNTATHQAAVITRVTQVSGLESTPGVSRGFKVSETQLVNSSFFDSQNSPSQTSDAPRDMLNAPPAADDSACPNGTGTQNNVLQNGNINVYP